MLSQPTLPRTSPKELWASDMLTASVKAYLLRGIVV
jgi:hypothetical protein